MDVRGHASGKVGASRGVQRNGQHPAQQTAVEGGDPLGTVLSPKQYAVALADALLGQESGESAGKARQIPVRADVTPVAPKMHHGSLAVKTAEIVDQCSEVIAHDSFGKINGSSVNRS
jgi:hypothetical protein